MATSTPRPNRMVWIIPRIRPAFVIPRVVGTSNFVSLDSQGSPTGSDGSDDNQVDINR